MDQAWDHVAGLCIGQDISDRPAQFTSSPPHFNLGKSFDTFGPMGPVVATGLDPMKLTVKTVLNGAERQNYPVSDMLRTPAKLVSEISHDVTLEPGDVFACGTNVGVGTMKEPENTVEIVIDGIGTLSNTFKN